ncbi:MAG: methyltransferase domain-containing protein [Anaerolineae bacterium]|nr:methyltransferase domain-containing protein [Anaerolineae bacterium]
MGWALGIGAALVIAALLYWQLIIAEGAYLGRRVVALLYDWSAHLYDRIKQYDSGYEAQFLGRPLANALFAFPNALVLDVATGTARLACALFPEVGFRGRIIGLDLARKMLKHAAEKTRRWSDRTMLIWDDASQLPFLPDCFEVVACLEALEFMPDPDQVLAEMVRVLRPGGILLITNRIGNDARLMPGRTFSAAEIEAKLSGLALEMVQVRPWQVEYDLVWATKPGFCTPDPPRDVEAVLRCSVCESGITRRDGTLVCGQGHTIPIAADGVVEMARVRKDL